MCICIYTCIFNCSCVDRIKKSVPHDNLLSALSKPCMPNGDPQDGFFYPTLTHMIDSYMGLFHENPSWGGGGFVNNTGADQPAHPRSLISAFVVHLFESIICKLATGEISIF